MINIIFIFWFIRTNKNMIIIGLINNKKTLLNNVILDINFYFHIKLGKLFYIFIYKIRNQEAKKILILEFKNA